MTEMTHEGALRLADELAGQELKETEARCSVLAQFIDACDRSRAHSAAWSDALRELHTLHGHRSSLIHRRTLIQQALDAPVGDAPSSAPLPRAPQPTAVRAQRQIQIQARRH